MIFHRHKDYVDSLTLCWDQENESYSEFCFNNTSLLKNLYWLVREKLDTLIPYDQSGVLSQFCKGADISLKPLKKSFDLSDSKQKIQPLLNDLSRKKLFLTSREWEVCKGLARGETAKETARVLGIHHRTVETYLEQIYKKFQTKPGLKPTRSQVLHQLYQTLDQELMTRTVWDDFQKKQES